MGKTLRRTSKWRKKKYLKHPYDQWDAIYEKHREKEPYGRIHFGSARLEIASYEGYYGNDPNSPWYHEFFHWMTTPSHWVRQFETRPKRQEERILCQKIIKGEIDPDNIMFPHARKPEIYYW